MSSKRTGQLHERKNHHELLNTKALPLAPEEAETQISRCWESVLRKSHLALLLFPKHAFIVGPSQKEINALDGSLYSW